MQEPKSTESVLSEATEILPSATLIPPPTVPPTLEPLPTSELIAVDEIIIETPSPRPTPTKSPTSSPSQTKTPSPFPSATSIATASPKPTTTSSVAIPTYTSQQINELINKYASLYSVSPDVLRHIALCESGFNPKASYLIYAGLYQFSPNTWISVRTKMGEDTHTDLRYNAEEAVQTAAYSMPNAKSLWPNCNP